MPGSPNGHWRRPFEKWQAGRRVSCATALYFAPIDIPTLKVLDRPCHGGQFGVDRGRRRPASKSLLNEGLSQEFLSSIATPIDLARALHCHAISAKYGVGACPCRIRNARTVQGRCAPCRDQRFTKKEIIIKYQSLINYFVPASVFRAFGFEGTIV
jgi:hypothetical protein